MVEAATQFLEEIPVDALTGGPLPPWELVLPVLKMVGVGGYVGFIGYAMSMFLANIATPAAALFRRLKMEAGEGSEYAQQYVAAGGYPERWVLASMVAGGVGAMIKALVEAR